MCICIVYMYNIHCIRMLTRITKMYKGEASKGSWNLYIAVSHFIHYLHCLLNNILYYFIHSIIIKSMSHDTQTVCMYVWINIKSLQVYYASYAVHIYVENLCCFFVGTTILYVIIINTQSLMFTRLLLRVQLLYIKIDGVFDVLTEVNLSKSITHAHRILC